MFFGIKRQMAKYAFSALLTLPFVLSSAHSATKETLRLYIDADFSVTKTAAEAISLGLRTALHQGGNRIAGHPVEVIESDHRNNPRRSHSNFKRFLNDPTGLAVFGGMQSPPYLAFSDFINASGIPLLLPWSAAAPVTRRAEGDNNYIFRLSVDDAKAGPFLVGQALEGGCENFALALVDTGWGRANNKTMTQALESVEKTPSLVLMIPPDVGPAQARRLARDIAASGADCTLAVLAVDSGQKMFNAMAEIGLEVPVYSHWGILGDQFREHVSHNVRESLSLRILQTCGLDVELNQNEVLQNALASASELQAIPANLRSMNAPTGFVHGYDLGRVLLAAAEQAANSEQWDNGGSARRIALKDALENLSPQVRGILRDYDQPFSTFSAANVDAHEALGADDLCLAKFDAAGQLISLRQGQQVAQ